jgi:cell division protein FtsB
MKKFFEKVNEKFPMSVGSFIVLLLIIYLMAIVGKTILDNYYSNKGISDQEQKLLNLENELEYLENEIVYYNSQSFKEKQARAKLGYMLPGEKIISVPKDVLLEKEKVLLDGEGTEESYDSPNYTYWYKYFFN